MAQPADKQGRKLQVFTESHSQCLGKRQEEGHLSRTSQIYLKARLDLGAGQ